MGDMQQGQDPRDTSCWRVARVDDHVVARMVADTGLSPIVAKVLAARGITDADEARRFIEPDLARDWLDPALIPGMSEAAARVAEAVRRGERILVFGDFDLDGISSAAVAARGLAAMGAHVSATVPNRFSEGYGLTEASVDRIVSAAPDLLITVDCGISSVSEVVALRDRGVDVVVTDHHEPSGLVPRDIAVADPKLDPGCRSRDLAGAGVALKLVEAVGGLLGYDHVWTSLTDLATLGTVADIVPLRGENRALVAHGVASMRTEPRVAVAALASVAGISVDALSADRIAYAMAPRLNAAGRMADPEVALALLMTDDPAHAEEISLTLDEHNRVRQNVEQDLTEAATALAEREFNRADRAIVLAGEGWHEGVKGIVASRLARAFGVPTLLFAIEDGEARGSGRSVGTVDLHAAVTAAADRVVRYGGHAAAVGVTVATDDLPAFKEMLLEHLATLPSEAFVSEATVDAEIDLDDLSLELAAEMELLEPFGHSNPRPLFLSRDVFMNARQRVGRGSDHLRFVAFDGTNSVPAIAFRCPDIERMADHDAAVDIAYELVADEWRGRPRLQLHARDLRVHAGGRRGAAAELLDDLFDRAEEIIAREEYAGIEDAESFHTKLAGVTFEGRQDAIARLAPGVPLRVVRQPDNPHDPNAIALFDTHGTHLGYFNRRLAAALAPVIDKGVEYDVEVTDLTGGADGKSHGVNVLVSRRGDGLAEEIGEDAAVRRAGFAALGAAELDAALVREFIGERELHEAQREALDVLREGSSCLTVMATGRGKSLIFQLHACRAALHQGTASVFVYPLRALVADQAFHLEEVLARMGLHVVVLTGETPEGARDEIFGGLASGDVDVVLTTPEFLDHHAERFAAAGRTGFLVVDEAHHVALSRAGHRPAYGRLGDVVERLGSPTTLAVTATAGDETAQAICSTLGIERVLVDPSTRENLLVEDKRDHADKDGYLAALAARGEKCIVYVNSREQSVRLARMLRKRVPDVAYRVAFYNGGVARAARHAVEAAFRRGEVLVVVATSAFGEGVNIPDIRNVVLYHLPFNDIEFNQMCGRAGRDGAMARIHPLFGSKDGKINDMILTSVAPDRDDMAALYLVLRDVSGDAEGWFEVTNQELADRSKAKRQGCTLNDRGVSSAIGIFRELGLLEGEGHGPYRRLRMLPRPDQKVDLASSVRYAEGLQEIEQFAQFRVWALEATADQLLARFNRPILPSRS